MSTIRQLHDHWAATIMPAGVTQTQRQEMERAFYSGVFAALTWQIADVAALPDDDAEKALASGFEECELFFRTLAKSTTDISRQ